MREFVLDCSVTMAWCFEDEANAYADAVLDALGAWHAVAPRLWVEEIANVLITAERKKRITPAGSEAFIASLKGLPIEVDDMGEATPEAVLAVARQFHLSAYDAVYFSLCLSRGLPLATEDNQLRMACKKGGVELFRPQ